MSSGVYDKWAFFFFFRHYDTVYYHELLAECILIFNSSTHERKSKTYVYIKKGKFYLKHNIFSEVNEKLQSWSVLNCRVSFSHLHFSDLNNQNIKTNNDIYRKSLKSSLKLSLSNLTACKSRYQTALFKLIPFYQ